MKSAMRRSMADIWSRSARILTSDDIRPPLDDNRFEAADLSDAQPGSVGDRDFGIVEDDAAIDWIELAERRSIEIDLGDDVRLGHGDVRGRRDADARLDHAADHALDLVHGRDVGDVQRAGDATGL